MDETSPRSVPPRADEPSPPAPRRERWRRFVAWLVFGYGLAVVALWWWMHESGDRRPLATLFLFGPRWICALPLPALMLAALVSNRRLLWPLAATALVIAGPIMGFRWHPPLGTDHRLLRVMTCNVERGAVRATSLARLIDELKPDVVALQEVTAGTPFAWPADWHVIGHDEFILASRFPIVERSRVARPSNPGAIAALRFTVELPDRAIDIFNLHFESPRPGIEAVINSRTLIDFAEIPRLQAILDLRAEESERASRWVAETPGPKIVMGDFNMPAESTIYRRDWSAHANAFSLHGWGLGFTKVSEKRGWSYGARIDHVLATRPLRCVRSFVAAAIGSDHLPLVADLVFD